MKFTRKMLKKLKPGIFTSGSTVDSPEGVNMTDTGNLIQWVAVRGQIDDWAIYCGPADWDLDHVRTNGQKVTNKVSIRKLVPCTDEAFNRYKY